ncbi:MAG TPA: DUF4249 domain-containing protein [Chryseolinea sp.]|jgi:hypothetical protein|nr:DUF4249 domain-containing protein [Chryseolinea sp.]
MKNLLSLIVVAVVFWSCDEPVHLDVNQAEPQLIIEGQVTNVTGHQYVKITRSAGFYDSGKTPRVIDATVLVRDDVGNEFSFIHNPGNQADSAGYYLPQTPFVGEIGRTYKLEATVDGQLYEATDRLFYVTPIDSLAYRLDEEEQEDPEVYGKFYEVMIYAKEPQETKDYYLFKFFRNDSLKTDFDTDIYFTDDETLGENIDGVSSPIYFAPGDRARCEIYSISRDAFVFYSDLQSLLNNDGGLFSQPPSNSRSNISNGALGFFQTSALHTSEIEIKP